MVVLRRKSARWCAQRWWRHWNYANSKHHVPGGTVTTVSLRLTFSVYSLLVLLALTGGESLAAAPPGPAQQTATGELIRMWQARSSAAAGSDRAEVKRANEKLITLLDDRGIRNSEPATRALVREVERLIEQGRLEDAKSRMTLLRRVGDGVPEAHWAQSRILREDNLFMVHTWALPWFRGLWHDLTSPSRAGNNVILAATGVALLAALLACVFLLAQVCRYFLHIFVGAGQVLPGAYNWLSSIVVLTVIFGGGLYFLGALSALCLLCGLLAIYQTPVERRLLTLCLLLLGLTPAALTLIDQGARGAVEQTAQLYRAEMNPTSRWAPGRAPSGLELLIEAKRRKRLGELDASLAALKAAEKALIPINGKPASRRIQAVLHNAFGNTYFGLQRMEQAQVHYEKASALMPDSAVPVYNLHRVYAETGRKEEAEASARNASRIDAQAVVRWDAEEGKELNRVVNELTIGHQAYFALLGSLAIDNLGGMSPLWVQLVGTEAALSTPLNAGIALLFITIMGFMRPQMRLQWPCERCACGVSVRLVDLDLTAPVCDQCTNIFLRSVPVDRRVRFAKEASVARTGFARRWLTRVASLAFPGAAHLMRGRLTDGFYYATVGAVALLLVALPERWVDTGGPALGSYAVDLVGYGLYALALLISIVSVFRGTREQGSMA